MAEAQRNPDRNTWGRRCEIGCESWPDKEEFKKCLRCGEPTTRYSNLNPLPLDEAMSLLSQARFNAYYAKRCAKLKIPPAGALPPWYEESLGPLPERLLVPSGPRLRTPTA